jgi:hypothetical protein
MCSHDRDAQQLGQAQRGRRAGHGRLHHEHHVGPPAQLRQQQRNARQRERQQVPDAPSARGFDGTQVGARQTVTPFQSVLR